jgi:hypothetical protein
LEQAEPQSVVVCAFQAISLGVPLDPLGAGASGILKVYNPDLNSPDWRGCLKNLEACLPLPAVGYYVTIITQKTLLSRAFRFSHNPLIYGIPNTIMKDRVFY